MAGRKIVKATEVRERVAQGKNIRPRDLAEAAGVSPAAVYGWIKKGDLVAVKFAGTVMITPSEASRVIGS